MGRDAGGAQDVLGATPSLPYRLTVATFGEAGRGEPDDASDPEELRPGRDEREVDRVEGPGAGHEA